MRDLLRKLTAARILERDRQPGFAGSVSYALGTAGPGLLTVMARLREWLRTCPDRALELGTLPAKSAVKALAEGWATSAVRALAARPLSLTELSSIITGVSYPSLERRLSAMRLAGQIAPCPGDGRTRPYAVTPWLRLAAAPLTAAVDWERHHLPEGTPTLTRGDIEAIFLLAVPLVRLAPDQSGSCRVVVESRGAHRESRLAGVTVAVEEGRVASCTCQLEGRVDAWASGSLGSWLGTMRRPGPPQLEVGGNSQLVVELLDRLSGIFSAGGQGVLPMSSDTAIP